MDYLWFKAFHIIAVTTWIGGMLTVAGTTSASSSLPDEAARAQFFSRIREWDRRVTTPAMLAVWVLGLILAVTGHLFPQPWLLAKIALVLALSALHGMLSGRLRRLATGELLKSGTLPLGEAAIVITVSLVVLLVVVRPF